ncbi:MAG TPA: ComF family protein [Thermoanaerobaculia bacterium]
MLSELAREAIRIVLPSWCVVCDRELPWRDRTASCCADCWRTLQPITGAKCLSCARPLAGEDHAVRCIECQLDPGNLLFCDAWGRYSGSLEKVLHAFKFERHDFLDDPLASLLENLIGDTAFDAIVPVPMSRAKERKRGYNQAERLARALSRRTGIRCELLLTKRGERATQSRLPRAERAKNVRGAFQASPRAGEQSILLVDDICTTGETLRACADALLRAGAVSVAAVTVAKTV